MVALEVGFSGNIISDTTKPNGQPSHCLGVSRTNKLFGFQAGHRLREGIPKVVMWFLARAVMSCEK